MLIQRIKSIFRPENFHGWGNRKRFFEGFYFKLLDSNKKNCIALIAGIAVNEKGENESFIQVLDDETQSKLYLTFDKNLRNSNSPTFELLNETVQISKEKIILDLPDLKANITFNTNQPWSKRWYSPGAMGPFTFLPYLECYHGILSMFSQTKGEIIFCGKKLNFENGSAYIEKDWGHSFPKKYIWIQCNNFKTAPTSLSISIAKTKYMGISFLGFLVGFYLHDELIEFTSYNFSKLTNTTISKEFLSLSFENRKYKLELVTNRVAGTQLRAPINGQMIGEVSESLSGEIDLKLVDKKTQIVLFQEKGYHVGLEVEWEND